MGRAAGTVAASLAMDLWPLVMEDQASFQRTAMPPSHTPTRTRPGTSLESRFLLNMRDLDPVTPVLAGVSGGRDSVVLLHLLAGAGFTSGTVCHLNHGLRGKNSDQDARFVKRVAKFHKMRFICEKIDLTCLPGESLEAVARRERQAFFARCARETGAEELFLGHHADDQAETFLWNLLRGSGRDGLTAMQPVSEMSIDGLVLRLRRPLLHIWREEIDAYVQAKGLKFREDASNRSKIFTRNKLRREIIPWLEKKLARNIREPLWRAAEIVRAENEWLQVLTGEFPSPDPLLIWEFTGQPLAWQRRRVLAWLTANGVPRCGFSEISAVLSLLEVQDGPPRVNLPGDLQARRRAGKIYLATQGKPD